MINTQFYGALEEFKTLTKKRPNQSLGVSIQESKEKNTKRSGTRIIVDSKAATAPKRTEIIVQNLKILADSQNFGLVREKGNLSTFSLPNREVTNPSWDHIKYRNDKEKNFVSLLRSQRYWIEKHTLHKSCKLIVHLEYGLQFKSIKHGLYRLKTLFEFLKTNRDKVDIVNIPPAWSEKNNEEFENLLIVGDKDNLENSFFAHSRSASSSEGIKDTYISPEPQEVAKKIEEFDTEFRRILDDRGLDIFEARNEVIYWLERKIKDMS